MSDQTSILDIIGDSGIDCRVMAKPHDLQVGRRALVKIRSYILPFGTKVRCTEIGTDEYLSTFIVEDTGRVTQLDWRALAPLG